MPRGDGTGPAGMGSMTGRAAGYCAGYSTPGYANPAVGVARGGGRGLGRGCGFGGRGRGFGFGRGFGAGRGVLGAYGAPWPLQVNYNPYPQAPGMAKEQEVEMLKAQEKELQTALNNITKRLDEIESKKS